MMRLTRFGVALSVDSVALVIVGHGRLTPFLQRQSVTGWRNDFRRNSHLIPCYTMTHVL